MNGYHLILLFLTLTIGANASEYKHLAGAKQAGMGSTGVTDRTVWSAFYNPAGLAGIENVSVGLGYENRFNLVDLSTYAVTAAAPVWNSVISISYARYGNEIYNENQASLGVSKQLFPRFSAGVQFTYLNSYIYYDDESLNKIVLDAGLLIEPLNNLFIGIDVFNPTGEKFTTFALQDDIPTIVRFGGSFNYLDVFTLNAELVKDLDQDTDIKAGLQYAPAQNLFIRLGIASKPSLGSFGLGLLFQNFVFDIAVTDHQILGFSSVFSLQYGF